MPPSRRKTRSRGVTCSTGNVLETLWAGRWAVHLLGRSLCEVCKCPITRLLGAPETNEKHINGKSNIVFKSVAERRVAKIIPKVDSGVKDTRIRTRGVPCGPRVVPRGSGVTVGPTAEWTAPRYEHVRLARPPGRRPRCRGADARARRPVSVSVSDGFRGHDNPGHARRLQCGPHSSPRAAASHPGHKSSAHPPATRARPLLLRGRLAARDL